VVHLIDPYRIETDVLQAGRQSQLPRFLGLRREPHRNEGFARSTCPMPHILEMLEPVRREPRGPVNAPLQLGAASNANEALPLEISKEVD
jgi:hypothetical protein